MAKTKIRIEHIQAGRINPAPYNPRKDLTPDDPEYRKIERSIDRFGCVEPLVWNRRTGHLVGGHQRFKILKDRGVNRIAVSVVDLPLAREKALNLALNKVTGQWDETKLGSLLDDLAETPEFEFTGFEIDEAEDLMTGAAVVGEEESFDVAASLAQPPITKRGDLIVLGRDPPFQHRLLCGDSTDAATVRRLMNGNKAVMMATDPPYLVGYTGTNHPDRAGEKRVTRNKDWSDTYGLDWDDAKTQGGLYSKFLKVAVAEALGARGPVYIWHASRRQAMVERAMTEAGLLVHCQIIWAKNRAVLTRGWYSWQHEPCLMGWPKGRKPERVDKAIVSTLWQVDGIAIGPDRPEHPTPKPLELFRIPMRQHTRPGEVCFEPFAGSGTQLIAAQRMHRRCFALELSPVYCDLIVRRFIAWAGEEAVEPRLARRYRIGGAH